MANDEASLAIDNGRRRFLNWFLGTTAGAFLIAVTYPLSRYLIPPEVEESTASTVTLSIKPNDVKANTGQIFRFGSQAAILIKTPNGELKAFHCGLHSPGVHRPVPIRYQPYLVRVPQWPLRSERQEYRGASAEAIWKSTLSTSGATKSSSTRGARSACQPPKHGKLWLWLDERIGLSDLAYLAKKKKYRCTVTRFGIISAA